MGIAALSFVCGCSQGPGAKSEPPASVRPLVQKVEEGQDKRRAIEAQYRAMKVPELVRRLEDDAEKGVEPFNSLAYREAVSRGQKVGKELATSIKTPSRTSFLTLMAVRKVDPETYRTIGAGTRVRILVDALGTSPYFNSWGLPHLYWEDPAKAMIELGNNAVEPLKALLRDKRAAPVWGSEEVMEYQKYKYRVCDYAWALLMEIRSKKSEIPTDPAVRDQQITRILGEGKPT
jgi:hypothetical protein